MYSRPTTIDNKRLQYIDESHRRESVIRVLGLSRESET